MAVIQHRDGRWYVAGRKGYWPAEPNRTKQYFGRGPGAEQAARARDAELGNRKAKPPPPSGPTVYALAVEYLAVKRFGPKSERELRIMLESLILPAIGHRQAIRLTHADIDAYVDRRRAHRTKKGTPVKDSTIRREITALKAILNWAVRRQPPLIAFNPIATYRAPDADDDIIIPPTPDEAEAIYRAASEHLRRCIILAWYLGLRPGAVELLGLTWADVSLGPGIIRIRSAHKGGPRFRDVPVQPGLRRQLEAWHTKDRGEQHRKEPIGPLIKYHGRPVKTIQTSWQGALERAGIKRRIRPYDMRHAFASRALEAGADIGAVSQVMGSAPETIRRHYQHVTREMTRRTVALIPELEIEEVGDTKKVCTKGDRRKRSRIKG